MWKGDYRVMGGGAKIVILIVLTSSLHCATEWLDAPSNITVDNEGKMHSLTVRWTPPIGNYQYNFVFWKSADSDQWRTGSGSVARPPSVTTYVIEPDLSPGAPYNVSIHATNYSSSWITVGDKGYGQGRTRPIPIVNITESGATNNSITAHWPKPTYYRGEYDVSYVDQYIIYCEEGSVQPDTPIPEYYNDELHEASCAGLPEAGAVYTIYVLSQSGKELSDNTTFNITTLPNQVTLTEGDSTLNSVSASWSTPSGYVSFYEIACSGDGVPRPQFINQMENETDFEARCTDFSITGGEYVMTVSSVQDYQRNPINITLRAVPNMASLIHGTATNETVSATWPMPEGVVDYFKINCFYGNAFPSLITVTDYSGLFNASCINLPVAGDRYTMFVTSVSRDLTNRAQLVMQALPNEAIPWEGSSTNETVSASWQLPDGVVTLFRIECSRGWPVPSDIYLSDGDTQYDVFNASCNELDIAGDEYFMSVSTYAHDISTMTVIYLYTLPNKVELLYSHPSNDSITATWNRPAGDLDHYEIVCSDDGISYPSYIPNSEGPFTASCTELPTSGAWYEMTVYSVSNADMTDSSSIDLQALPNTAGLVADSPTNETVSATWPKPAGFLDFFEIQCSEGDANPSYISVFSYELYNASCTGLPIAGAFYYMTVRSVVGDMSNTARIQLQALPNSVDLREGTPSTRSVSASWVLPSGRVTHFYASCSSGYADPFFTNASHGDVDFSASCYNVPTAGGIYEMTIKSCSGDMETPTIIFLRALPNPVSFTEGSSSVDSVTALWNKPSGLTTKFEIECSEGVAFPSVIMDLCSNDFSASCANLDLPGDDYTITVRSFSDDKNNTASKVLTAVPLRVVLYPGPSTATSVSADWSHPGGIVDHFIVDCGNGTENLVPLAIDVEDDEEFEYSGFCDDLDNPGDEYTITVISVSNNQKNSTSIVLSTLPEAVELKEEDSTTSSIVVSWDLPNGIFEYFEVFCQIGIPSASRVYPTDQLIASCEDLNLPGDDYTITVITVMDDRRSENSSLTITTKPNPVYLHEGESNSTAISAYWIYPNITVPNKVDSFHITCSYGLPSSSVISVYYGQNPETLKAHCVSLPTPGLYYNISVVSKSKDKWSSISYLEVQTSANSVTLIEGPSTLSSVSASWTSANAIVDSYTISCSHGYADPPLIEDTTFYWYSASCLNLPGPGATYTMTVFTAVVGISNTSSWIQLITVPESVGNFTTSDYTTTTVTLDWQLKQCPFCVYEHFSLSFYPDSTDPIIVDYLDNGPYRHTVGGLTEGRSYDFSIVSVSGIAISQQNSTAKSVSQRTLPASPTNLVITPFEKSLSLAWSKAVGDVDDYVIGVAPDHGNASFSGDLSNPTGEVTGLQSSQEYQVSVFTISGDEISEGITETTRTLDANPSPVRNASAYFVDKNTAIVSYAVPEYPEGIIVLYLIGYVGTREGLDDHTGSVETEDTRFTFTNLFPGLTYTFSIIAVNDRELESDPVETNAVEMPQEEPVPVPPEYPYEENTEVSQVQPNSITVQLPEDLFSHDNGVLTSFSVIISESENATEMATTSLSYDEAKNAADGEGKWPAYITVEHEEYPYPPQFSDAERKIMADNTDLGLVDIGTEVCPDENQNGYCNGPLKEDTKYFYSFRAYNDIGSVSSGTFGPVETEKEVPKLIIGLSVSLSVVVLIVIIVAAYFFRRRRSYSNLNQGGQHNAAFEEEHLELAKRINRKSGSSMHKKNLSKPILLSEYETVYRRLKTDSEYKFAEEFEEFRSVGKDQEIVAAISEMNRAKNRYTNILPYDHSRVKLGAKNDELDTDYVNASYIPGYTSSREFISCQGPLPGTVDDMWRMVWEKRSTIIVMLTHLEEGGKDKCHQYWPREKGTNATYGSIEVLFDVEHELDHWIIRKLVLFKGGMKRKVTQFQFTSWPDHGVPEESWIILDFVRIVRKYIQKQSLSKPVVVHCSAGVGRTGVYIALDRLMQHMKDNDFIDIFGAVCEMRMQRNYMVQTENQYIFIHDCVMDLLMNSDDQDISGGVEFL